MHIPTKETKDLQILSFEEARRTREGSAGYDRERWIYIPDFYSDYRYVLGTIGKKPLITIGINPSTAAPDALDNTLRSVERIANGNDFDSFIMFNVYAQRATNPKDMDRTLNRLLHEENMKAFRFVLENSGENPAIWAAWGTTVEKRDYLKECLEDMIHVGNEFGASWYRTGALTKCGHPHHPLYLKKDSKLEYFDIDSYVQKL